MSQLDKIRQEIVDVMCVNNKELLRRIDQVAFTMPPDAEIIISELKISPEMSALRERFTGNGQNTRCSIFMEKALSTMFPKSQNVIIQNATSGNVKYELDCVQVIDGRFVLISACLDTDKVNVYEHIYEARIHALRYGGFRGEAICVLPHYQFDEADFDQIEARTICGVKVFDKTAFYDDGELSAENFVKSLKEYIVNITKFVAQKDKILENMRDALRPNTDIELYDVLKTSQRSFDYVLEIIRGENNFIYEKVLIKLDECLFQYIGVKGEGDNYEWLLICRLDVPPYEQSITAKYRNLIYMYVVTAIKYTGGHFRMLIFTNNEDSLEDECKTLGNDMRLRVLSINARQWRILSNADKNLRPPGARDILQAWSNGTLANSEKIVQELRVLNAAATRNIEIKLEYISGKLILQTGGKKSAVRKSINKALLPMPKQGAKFVAEFSRRTGQFISIHKKGKNYEDII